jgi:anti-sigma B factor antagonist
MERDTTSAAEYQRISIEVDEHDDVRTVTVNGEIDLDTSVEFGLALVGAATIQRVDVDLTGVSYIDSAGLRSLLIARSELHEQGVMVRVVGASTIVTRLFEIAGVGELLTG